MSTPTNYDSVELVTYLVYNLSLYFTYNTNKGRKKPQTYLLVLNKDTWDGSTYYSGFNVIYIPVISLSMPDININGPSDH